MCRSWAEGEKDTFTDNDQMHALSDLARDRGADENKSENKSGQLHLAAEDRVHRPRAQYRCDDEVVDAVLAHVVSRVLDL
jgi:hypothetical protein